MVEKNHLQYRFTGVEEGDAIPYYCQIHPYMTSKLTVSVASSDASVATAGPTLGNIDSASAGDNVTTAPVTLTIPQGASVQGNPSYEPDPLTVRAGDTIAVDNEDSAPHTVTNGKDATDPNMGKLFDTSIINAGDSAEIVTADLDPGEYPFFCSVHPYMAGILYVQGGSQDLPEDAMNDQEPSTGEEQPGTPVKADPELIKELLNNAIDNLQSGKNERAIVYMDFVRQQLLIQATNTTIPKSTQVLVSDAIDSLQRGNSNSAALFLDQANDQLALLIGDNQTSISNDIIAPGKAVQNTTGTVQGNETSSATGEIPATIIPQDNQTAKSFPENTTRPEVTNRTAEQDLKNMTGTLNATGTPMSPEEDFFCYTFGDDGTCDESQLDTNTASPMITLVPWESSRHGLKIQYPSTWQVSEFADTNMTTTGSIEEQLNLAKEKIANARQAGAYGSPTSLVNFDMFMSSFSNSIFNGTSIFGGVGTSMVDGVRVSGIGLDKNGSQLSVTLTGAPTEILGGNNTAGTRNDTTVTSIMNSSNSVSLIAMRVPIHMTDILSLAVTQGMGSDMMTGNIDSGIFPSDSSNPFSLLNNLQIGSTSITNVDWSVPQTVAMNLVGGNSSQEQQPYSNNTPAADFLLVSVIPYTGFDS